MIMTEQKLAIAIKNVGRRLSAFRDSVQEVLVSCAYQAMMGNPNFANDLLAAIVEGERSAAHIEGITRWAETYAPLIYRHGKFLINKVALKKISVADEEAFAPYELEMRRHRWWEMAEKQRPPSIFDPLTFVPSGFEKIAKKLNSEGFPELSAEVAALGKLLYSTNVWKGLAAPAEAPTAEAPTAEAPRRLRKAA